MSEEPKECPDCGKSPEVFKGHVTCSDPECFPGWVWMRLRDWNALPRGADKCGATAKLNPDVGPNGWDKEGVYDREIAPLAKRIIEICKREELPLFLSVIYRQSDDTGDGRSFDCTTHLPGPKGEVCPRFVDALNAVRPSRVSAVAITVIEPKGDEA